MSMEDIIVTVEVGPQGAAGEGVPVGGTTGQVLAKASGTDYDTEWVTSSGGSGSVATDAIWDAKGDLAVGTGSNTASRLAVGTDNQVLTADSSTATGTKWSTLATAATSGSHTDLSNIGTNTHAQIDTHIGSTANPHSVTKAQVGLTNVTDDAQLKIASNLSDLANASTARTNLGVAIGTDVQAYDAELAAIAGLTSAADKLPYFTGSGTAGLTDLTAAGRAILDDANAAAQRTTLGVGAIGTLATIATTINVTFDGMGSVLTVGNKAILPDLKAMTITSWTLVSEQSGSVVIDVWKSTYGSYPPVIGGSIAGTEKPTLSSSDKNQDTSLSSWSTTISDGDCLIFNIDSVTTIEKCVLTIKGNRVA